MNDNTGIGSMVKVNLRGETPWAEILEIHHDGFTGRIANKLFSEFSEFEKTKFVHGIFGKVSNLPKLHNYKHNDVVIFKKIIHNEYVMLVPEGDVEYYKGK